MYFINLFKKFLILCFNCDDIILNKRFFWLYYFYEAYLLFAYTFFKMMNEILFLIKIWKIRISKNSVYFVSSTVKKRSSILNFSNLLILVFISEFPCRK